MATLRGEGQAGAGGRKSGSTGVTRPFGAAIWRIEALPGGLLDRPIDYLAADHARQRHAADILTRLSEGAFDRDGVRRLASFMAVDFAMHIADEEQSLFPILAQRRKPEDHLEAIIEVLHEEHAEDNALARIVAHVLSAAVVTGRIDMDGYGALKAFASHVHEHISLEDGVLIPIARLRLTKTDLTSLSEAMRKRRGARKS